MNDFIASNGVMLSIAESGHVMIPPIATGLGEETQTALRELFRAKEDERLGRWRWSENPDYVVYALGDEHPADVQIIRESDGSVATWSRGWTVVAGSDFERPARAYFDAHPESKPWHDAKLGEAWLLTINGTETTAIREADEDFFTTMPSYRVIRWNSDHITDGRRIWPTEGDNA